MEQKEGRIERTIKVGIEVLFQHQLIGIGVVFIIILINIVNLFRDKFLQSFLTSFAILVPGIFIIGLISNIITFPFRKRQQYFSKIFADMKFYSVDGETPVYIGEADRGYAKILAFRSRIPLETWVTKKSLLETYLNTGIIKVEKSPNDNNVACVYIELQPLPSMIPWEQRYSQAVKTVLSVGMDYEGIIIVDLEKTPHAFVAGETGSGKSNLLKCMIYQCLEKKHEVKLIDFKRGVSFSEFSDMLNIYYDYDDILRILEQLVVETNRRLDLLVQHKVENIGDYNYYFSKEEHLNRIVVFIDELAELMRAGDKETSKKITNCLESLSRISRVAGINLIMGIQRPDSTVINGQIKSNVPLRICGRFVDPEPSRIMLGCDQATELPNIKGRFLLNNDGLKLFQAFYINKQSMPMLMNNVELEEWRGKQTKVLASKAEIEKTWDEVKETIRKEKDENRINFNFDDIKF